MHSIHKNFWLQCFTFRILVATLAYAFPANAEISLERGWRASPVFLQSIEYSSDGQSLLTASGGGVAQLWSLDGVAGPQFKGQRPPMFNAHFNAIGTELITTGYDGTVWVWSPRGERLRAYQMHRAATTEAQFLPSLDGELPGYATSSDDGQIVIRNSEGKSLWVGQFVGTARQVISNHDGSLIIASSDSGQLHFIRPSNKRTSASVDSYQTPHGRINQIAFSNDQQRIVVAGKDGTATIWTLTGKQQQRLKASTIGWSRGGVYCNTHGQSVLTVGDDGIVREWSTSGLLVDSLRLSSAMKLSGIDCSPDGRQAVVIGSDGELWILSVSPNQGEK